MKTFFQRHFTDTKSVIFEDNKFSYIEKTLTGGSNLPIKYEHIDFTREPQYVTNTQPAIIFGGIIFFSILLRAILVGIFKIEPTDNQILTYFIPALIVVFIGLFFISRKKMVNIWLFNGGYIDFFANKPSVQKVSELVDFLFKKSKEANKNQILLAQIGEDTSPDQKRKLYKHMQNQGLIDDQEFEKLNQELEKTDKGQILGFKE